MFTQKCLTAARMAWVELSRHMDDDPTEFKNDDEFAPFYTEVVEKLFEEKAED